MRNYLIIAGLLFPLFGKAQLGLNVSGARATAMGNSAVTIADHWAIFNNVAGLAWVEQSAAALGYDSRYNVEAWRTVYAGFIAPVPRYGTFGMAASRFGDDIYNEQQLGISLARQIANVALGLRANLLQYHIESVGNRAIPTFDFGALVQLSEQLYLGGRVTNMMRAKFSDFMNERLPSLVNVGLSYRPHERLMVNLEAEKDIDKLALYRFGIEYQPVKNGFVRAGANTFPTKAFFGVGYVYQKFSFDYAIDRHQVLGFSHHFAISFKIERRKQASPMLENAEKE
ncbi:MAG: hypothetical protein NZM38_05225 [Cytophagales bacterium]|nr:hypothetical protein [Cytophagales bacterium]MDW8384155.1 hypothetical protein [Flammeovirgaceae bacterium]